MTNPNFRTWEREELEALYEMSNNNCTISKMCRELNRSHKSVIHALKRIQTQQALFHPIHEIAALYDMDVETLSYHLKDPLFYIEPLKKNDIPFILIVSTVLFGLVSFYGSFCYKDI